MVIGQRDGMGAGVGRVMRGVCFEGTESVKVMGVEDPKIEDPFDAIVDVEIAGICGSDLHPYFGREVGLDHGTVMGHEFVGRVSAVGNGVKNIEVGDRVCSPFTTSCGNCFYCHCGLTARCERGQLFGWRSDAVGLHGGQAEQVRVPLADGTLVRIPDEIDSETALLLGDNLSTGYFGASMCIDPQTAENDLIAVIGCGTVGLLAIVNAKMMDVKRLVAIEPNDHRRSIAERLGAVGFADHAEAVEAISRSTNGRGADGVMEFVGLPEAQQLAYQLIRPGGRMSIIGCHCAPHFAFSPADAYDKNLKIGTGRSPARFYMEHLAQRLLQASQEISWCVTHRFGIDDAEEAYQVFANQRENCVKAILTF